MIQQLIYLSRRAENSIEFEHEVLRIPLNVGEETSFELRIINYGEPSHLHFSLSEEIADRVMLLQDKVYVIEEEKITAIARLPKSYAGTGVESGLGEITVSTGYGAVRESFMVEIVPAKGRAKRERAEKHVTGVNVKVKEPKREAKAAAHLQAKNKRQKHIHHSHILVTSVSTALFLLSLSIVSLSSYPFSFIFAIIASALFLLIIVYNV